jgi:hypothetical protein
MGYMAATVAAHMMRTNLLDATPIPLVTSRFVIVSLSCTGLAAVSSFSMKLTLMIVVEIQSHGTLYYCDSH